ncbi:MAG: hypothetical protein HOI95_29160 [Chromatiales bacterium]|jgi:hypothetical protein|nr:hypothetical protein [Chromatiales bacterium]
MRIEPPAWVVRVLDRHIHWILIGLFSLGVFVFIMIMNPQTLAFFGLKQLDCDLPEHAKCIAPQPGSDSN